MRKLVLALLFGFLAIAATANSTSAQAATGFSGKAVRWNGSPISGATVSVLAGPLESDQELARTTTGADGSWSLQVPAGGPYWVHIHTLGEWWGYSYQTPFTLVAGEQISQLYLALGPRDVQEIALPTPVSNVGPQIGVGEEEPVNNVGPAVGIGEDDPQPGMPTTGEGDGNRVDGTLLLALGAAVLLLGSGLRLRLSHEK